MPESKHTPGEWEAIAPRKAGRHWRIHADDGTVQWHVATVYNGAPGDTLETEEANARLFAAAKDLLAACEEVLLLAGIGVRYLDSQMVGSLYPNINHAAIERAEKAIAKAKGETRDA